MLLGTFLVLVLRESTGSLLEYLPGTLVQNRSKIHWLLKGYLRYQTADILCQKDLGCIRYSVAGSSFLDMFLFVFQLQGWDTHFLSSLLCLCHSLWSLRKLTSAHKTAPQTWKEEGRFILVREEIWEHWWRKVGLVLGLVLEPLYV